MDIYVPTQHKKPALDIYTKVLRTKLKPNNYIWKPNYINWINISEWDERDWNREEVDDRDRRQRKWDGRER